MASFRTAPAFSLVVLLALGLFGFFALVLLLPAQAVGLLGHTAANHAFQHFRAPEHRVHDLTFALLLGAAGVGLVAQLRSPFGHAAGQLVALLPFVSLAIVSATTNPSVLQLPWLAVGALTVVATTLHPAGLRLVGQLGVARTSRPLLGLLAVAAVPLLALATTNLGLQRTVPDEHAALGHYGFTAALSFSVIGVGLIASLRPDGWRLPAWVAGVLPALFGVTSLLFPGVEPGIGPAWASASIAWGALFVAAAELTGRAHQSTPERGEPPARPRAATPGWASVSAVVGVGLLVVFAAMHLAGGGPALHTAGRTVHVTTLDSMAFDPARIDVSAGETVTFVVTNRGLAVHEFTIGDAATQQQHAAEMAHRGGGAAHHEANSITLRPGETRQLTWRFGAAGTLEYACHEPGHYEAGMRGRVSVT